MVHMGLFLGTFLAFVGQVIWVFYENVLVIPVPYPSAADVFYLSGFVAITFGMAQFMSYFSGKFTEPRVVVALVLSVVAIIVTMSVLFVSLMVIPVGLTGKIVLALYPILGLMTLILGIFMLWAT